MLVTATVAEKVIPHLDDTSFEDWELKIYDEGYEESIPECEELWD